jgi:uncharacterized membrane protein YkoI
MKLTKVFLTASAMALGLGAAATAYAFSGQQYAKQAKVSLADARQIALNELPDGKVTGQELEHEKGGGGLRYSFDIKVGQVTHEVGVDAETGKVLENSIEGPNAD